MKSRVKNYIISALFVFVITAPMVSWGILSYLNYFNPQIMETVDFDLNEKRKKATLSEIIKIDTIASELDAYYNDRVPYRSALINFKRYLDYKIDEPYQKSIQPFLIKNFGRKLNNEYLEVEEEVAVEEKYMEEACDIFNNHGLKSDEIDPYDSETEYPIKYLNIPRVIMGQSNWLYLNEGNIKYYTGEYKIASDSVIKNHIATYERAKSVCDRLGKDFVIAICPEKEEIYPEYMPTMEIYDSKEVPLYIRDYIEKNTKLNYIYPKEELIKAKKNYLVYRKYDSHWNYIGGYIMANKIKEAIGVKTKPLRENKLKKVEALDADLAFYGNTHLDSLPLTFNYEFVDYKPNNEIEVIFTKNKVTIDSYTTHCKQGDAKKVFLVGDSFREYVDDFFMKDFSEFYCNIFTNAYDDFIIEEIKRADSIVIMLVERNETEVLPQLCMRVSTVLEKYEDDLRKMR